MQVLQEVNSDNEANREVFATIEQKLKRVSIPSLSANSNRRRQLERTMTIRNGEIGRKCALQLLILVLGNNSSF